MSGGGGPATDQVPQYFFSPSAVSTGVPAACTQAHYNGSFMDISYYVADQNSLKIAQAGLAPGESLNGGTWNDAFATPTVTGSNGVFDDTPSGACYSVTGHYCQPASNQDFRLTVSGDAIPYNISTTTTGRNCTDGVQKVIGGNPTNQNKTYTFGNVQ